MKRIYSSTLIIFIIVGLCFGCGKRKTFSSGSQDFFGIDLNEEHQVAELHDKLLSGEVLFEGKQLKEWDGDFIGSDFDLSDGRITSMVVTDGPMDEIEKTHYRLDSVFSSQYGMGENLKQKEWVGEGNNYYIEYLNFYDYNTYRICLALRLYSPTKDEGNVSRGVVRVGLGERKE